MARWAVIRVDARDGQDAQRRLTEQLAPITMSIDTRPPAAAPEWEIRVQNRTEAELRAALEPAGWTPPIFVLASKTELDEPLWPELDELFNRGPH